MKCNKCGHNNDNNTIFCKNCGERLEAAPKEVEVNTSLSDQNQNDNKNENQNRTVNNNKYEKQTDSFLGKAWKDITCTKSWFGKAFVLGLINCVPILNFASTGYAQQWGVDASRGQNKEMPEGYITNKTFLSGFFELITWIVWAIVWGVAAWIVTSIFGIIPIIGGLIGLAVAVAGIFWESIISLASLRCAFDNELGQSFKIKEIFKSWKDGWGQLFVCYFVPSLIFKLISVAAAIILLLVCGGALLPTLLTYGFSAISTISTGSVFSIIYELLPYIAQFAGVLFLCIIVIVIVSGIIGATEKLLRYRAIGYWFANYGNDLK